MSTTITVDMAGALRKNLVLKALPVAARKQVEMWAVDTVTMLKRSASDMKSSDRKTGHMARNVSMRVEQNSDFYSIYIGTGLPGFKSVKYANIQDKGGVIRAKGKMLTIPAPGVKGTIHNYPGGFFMKTRKGNTVYFAAPSAKSGRVHTLKPLFLLRRQVTIPASGWFTTPINVRKPALAAMMQPGTVYKVAEGMV